MRIEARELSAGYGRRAVVQEIDLSVAPGELVGLIGPNGSGKSTLLRAISGVLPSMKGHVALSGCPLTSLSAREKARLLSFVPQTEPALFDFTVREVVLMGRYAHRSGLRGEGAQDHDEAARAMATADVLHLAERPITALSGGEHRRVLLARALAQNAPIMLLDEPTAHLDVTHETEVLALLRRLADETEAAIVIALHDINLAADHCDRLVLLSGGRIVADGTPETVMTTELLSRAYGGNLVVTKSPASGRPFLVVRTSGREDRSRSLRIHVICGGGSGREVLSSLHRHGYCVSAGVLNRLDSDEEAASALGVAVALEAPFSPIGDRSRAEASSLIQDADAVVVAPVAIGHGNVANLDLALEALSEGKRVWLMGGDLGGRDFTGGPASKLWEQLKQGGAIRVQGVAELEAQLARVEAPDASI
jgi:iron complex transport system ATP-binding protein